ncbi:DNA glycosylase AlkZ-like family protein [Tenggerimyces flavus]|uniref:DNA glycosylase AlkZ-like family protein n=1 Tax=Tenggerimyces flavus TaxID=1708749 RepID=A0ABV7Y941_9ACTN|nr:crosslink repair DNA glycosylase YcaQ family protein [Tenggerimyces flavus]MBM7783638.1 hypothetical protein [Tenggerimyces flavus]
MIEKLRAWWGHRQGLDGSLAGASAAEVLARSGWARSGGGCAPYLTLFARAGIDREAVDKAVDGLEIHELPSVRGCVYVLSREHFALGLRVGDSAPLGDLAGAAKLGVSEKEIDELASAVVAALSAAGAPLDPKDLKTATGDLARGLGEQGRKRGLSSTMPLALGLLQAQGRIRRVPVNGRLDQQRFGYVPWSEEPSKLDKDEARTSLARLYFRWAGPASMKHFRWFSAFSAANAKQAVEPLGLESVEGTELLMLPEDKESFDAYVRPKQPSYALVAAIDGIHLLHRDLRRLVEPRPLLSGADPESFVIVDRGEIVGVWEYDFAARKIVYRAFVAEDTQLRKAIKATETYVRDQLGDARSYSLDSPESRQLRLEVLRAR